MTADSSFSNAGETRHRVLLAFAQLRHSTRQKFLPWLWEHLQSLSPQTRVGLDGGRDVSETVEDTGREAIVGCTS